MSLTMIIKITLRQYAFVKINKATLLLLDTFCKVVEWLKTLE